MSEHTPGKVDLAWEPGKYGVIGTVGPAEGKILAVVYNDGGEREKERKANAERFVASWNACSSLPTSALQPGSVKRLVEAASRIRTKRINPPHDLPSADDLIPLFAALAPFLGKEEE